MTKDAATGNKLAHEKIKPPRFAARVRGYLDKQFTGDVDYLSQENETRDEQRILATYAWHLGRYLIEHDGLPEDFPAGKFMCWSEHYPELSPEDKIEFVDRYAQLEKCAKKVTARTLLATRIHGRGFLHAAFRTAVGQYLVFLAIVTAIFVTLVLVDPMGSIAPFWAAGLGTCIYLLRVTQEKMKTREFDPAFVPSHLIRLLLGILAGGSIALVPDLVGGAPFSVTVGQTAFAFLLGYAVEIYYSVLDNIGGDIERDRS